MAYASQVGRARTSSKSPQAHAICDRCGFRYNFVDLTWQFDWRGTALQNLRILVCPPCRDTPQQQLRAIVLPADPEPIINARPQDFVAASTDYHAVYSPPATNAATGIPIPGDILLVTEDCLNLTQSPVGTPHGLAQSAVMPWNGTAPYGAELPVLAVNSDGSCIVTVICATPHGLQTNAQVSVEGVTVAAASGFYSVTATTATVFTYQTVVAIPAQSLLTSSTLIWTASIGAPYGYNQLPAVAP